MKVTNFDGAETTYAYSANGLSEVVHANGSVLKARRNHAQRTVAVSSSKSTLVIEMDRAGRVKSFAYLPVGNAP